jgi:hypothetical protein
MYFKFTLKKTGDPLVTYDYDNTTLTQMPTSDIRRTDVGLEIEKRCDDDTTDMRSENRR